MFYLFLSCEEVDHSGQILDKSGLDPEVFVGVKVQILLAESILLEELD